MIVYTVGHGTLPEADFIELVRNAGVDGIVDVRSYPGSRRNPQYGRAPLEQWLPGAGVAYTWDPRLGGRRRPVATSLNTALRHEAFQGYADHMATHEFQDALAELEGRARELSTAIMCAEAVWWRCHRRLISDALVARGWRAEHLGIGEGRAVHELPPFAIVEPEGLVRYPPQQASLLP